jgi:hypothetical protein
LAARYRIWQRFCAGFVEIAKGKTKFHANISPGQYGWVGANVGRRGLGFNYVVRQHETHVELYIDWGPDSKQGNKEVLDTLAESTTAMEAACGDTLDSQPLEGKRECLIRKMIPIGGYLDEGK